MLNALFYIITLIVAAIVGSVTAKRSGVKWIGIAVGAGTFLALLFLRVFFIPIACMALIGAAIYLITEMRRRDES